MSSSSKVIVVSAPGEAEARAARQLQLGLDREGIPCEAITVTGDAFSASLDGAGLVLVTGSNGASLDTIRAARAKLATTSLDIPLVFSGTATRADAIAAGADEAVVSPAYLRDVVTVARLLRGQPAAKREHLIGSLAETTNVFTLVRALAALGRSAVLTMMRGLRRGEIRFFHGEVTSAELALIHGQAALHQLLLWTEARFEYLHEDVVRRQQIPLSHDELFTDMERFLEGVRESSGSLSPAQVLEPDVARIQSLGRQVPTEVHGVLHMFDGHRVLADILEDSPYRVFETLRVTQRAVEAGLLRVVESVKPKATWRAVLGIEEWLTGQTGDEAVATARADITAGNDGKLDDTVPRPRTRTNRSVRGKKAEPAPASRSSRPEIDWGALVPRIVGAEVGRLSTVVPAAQRSGEISLPTRSEEPRERLEALMDTAQREKIFVLDQSADEKIDEKVLAEARATAEAEAKAKAEADAKAKADAEVKADTDRRATEERIAIARKSTGDHVAAAAKARAEAAKAEAEAKALLDAAAKAKADAEAALEAATWATIKADAESKAAVDAEAKATAASEARAKADAAAKAKADEEAAEAAIWATAKTEAETRQAADDAKATAEAEIKAKAEAFAKAKGEADAKAQAEADAKAKADAEAKAKADAELKATADAAAKAMADAAAADADAKAKAEAEIKAKAEAFAKATADAAAKEKAAAQAKIDEAKAKVDEEASLKKALAAEELARKREEAAEAEDAKLRADTANIARKAAASRAEFLEKKAREEEDLVAKVAATRKSVDLQAAASDVTSGPVPKATTDRGSWPRGASPDPDSDMSEEEMWAMVEARARAAAADTETRPVPKIDADELVRELKGGLRVTDLQEAGVPAVPRTITSSQTPNPVVPPPIEVKGDKLIVEESATATVVVQDTMSVRHTEKTAHLTSTATVTVTENLLVAREPTLSSGAPTKVEDEPSDGRVREVPTVETAPQRRPPPPGAPDDADRPEARTGEIVQSRTRTGDLKRPGSQPSILVDGGESILVGDLHAAQSAIAAVTSAQANVPAPATANLAASPLESTVGHARTDAVAALDTTGARMLFTDVEEEFFRAGKEKEKDLKVSMTGSVEKFDDLDEGYQPVGFWDRLRGKKPEPPK